MRAMGSRGAFWAGPVFAVVCAVLLAGCCPGPRIVRPDPSGEPWVAIPLAGVAYCYGDIAWVVSDGHFLPGVSSSAYDAYTPVAQDVWVDRVFDITSEQRFLELMQVWALLDLGRGGQFAVLAVPPEPFDVRAGQRFSMEPLHDVAKRIARETDTLFLLVVVPPDQEDRWRRDLQAAGLVDGTDEYGALTRLMGDWAVAPGARTGRGGTP